MINTSNIKGNIIVNVLFLGRQAPEGIPTEYEIGMPCPEPWAVAGDFLVRYPQRLGSARPQLDGARLEYVTHVDAEPHPVAHRLPRQDVRLDG